MREHTPQVCLHIIPYIKPRCGGGEVILCFTPRACITIKTPTRKGCVTFEMAYYRVHKYKIKKNADGRRWSRRAPRHINTLGAPCCGLVENSKSYIHM